MSGVLDNSPGMEYSVISLAFFDSLPSRSKNLPERDDKERKCKCYHCKDDSQVPRTLHIIILDCAAIWAGGSISWLIFARLDQRQYRVHGGAGMVGRCYVWHLPYRQVLALLVVFRQFGDLATRTRPYRRC